MTYDAPLRTAWAVGLGTHLAFLAILAATTVPAGPRVEEFPGAFAAEIRPVRAEAIPLAIAGDFAEDSPSAAPFESPLDGLPAEPEEASRPRAIGLDGRPVRRRARLVAEGGGSRDCSSPVGHALKWLVYHQEYEGSWSCDHGKAPGHVGPAFDGGSRQSRGGSTGLALLCFLGVGQTHVEGEYPAVVRNGLRYLLRQGRPGPRGIDFRGPHGDLYDHGIVALALCEAYDQTGDPALAAAAQGALDFTMFAQDRLGGGWRYLPGEAGDTSVTAWHLQALRSGHLAGLRVDPATIRKTAAFLDSVQVDGGAGYGYRSPVPRPGTTAGGLLCRLHCGHDPDDPPLRRGIEAIVRRPYDPQHPYDAYYRTQLTAYLERDQKFRRHSEQMIALEDSQVRRGSYQAECGSWPAIPGGPTAAAGGRLVTTALSCLAVEVRAGQLRIFEATSRRSEQYAGAEGGARPRRTPSDRPPLAGLPAGNRTGRETARRGGENFCVRGIICYDKDECFRDTTIPQRSPASTAHRLSCCGPPNFGRASSATRLGGAAFSDPIFMPGGGFDRRRGSAAAATSSETATHHPARKVMAKDAAPDKGKAGAPAKGTSPKATAASAEAAAKAEKKRRAGLRGELEEMKELGGFMYNLRVLFKDSPAFAFSAVVHLILVLVLALVTFAPDVKEVVESLTGTNTSDNQDEEKLEEIKIETPQEMTETPEETQTFETVQTETVVETPENTQFMEEAAPMYSVPADVGIGMPSSPVTNATGKTTGKGLDGRGAKARAKLVAEGGGSSGSEAAVGHALKWFAVHQFANGSWSFDHGKAPGHVGPVNQPGKHASPTGAAGMALLTYLGAGQTHMEGEYKEVVKKGLYYLGSAMKSDRNGGDLRGAGGSLYDHAIATIALCEAYAITQDKGLAAPAQAAINFIHFAQDKTGGGWRYTPGQAGDTSVVGWQIQALKSGHLAYLKVEPKSVAGAISFLNSTQTDGGAFYGYETPGKSIPLTSVGLLCRMYLGWKKDEPALQKGVAAISRTGPTANNMYYNYYATQIMRHYGGDEWTKWNAKMRDMVVSTQEVKGNYQGDKGSWKPAGTGHSAEAGGRLCETAFCTMILEVYYRHLPLYKEAAGESDF